MFLALGGRNLLPLTYVENCADAILVAGGAPGADGQVFNLVDDDLPTCREYLRLYQAGVTPLRTVPLPYPALRALSHLVERYHHVSQGQLPAFFTPYRTATTWKGNRFDNLKIKSLGWRQRVPTADGLRLTFAHLRDQQRVVVAA
jgi:nucleoside-diphosphate-sugar epimerase